MAEMEDALHSECSGAWPHVGSTPSSGITTWVYGLMAGQLPLTETRLGSTPNAPTCSIACGVTAARQTLDLEILVRNPVGELFARSHSSIWIERHPAKVEAGRSNRSEGAFVRFFVVYGGRSSIGRASHCE